MAEIVRATQAFQQGTTFVRVGDLFYDDDPIVVGRAHLFEAIAASVRTTATVPGPVASPPPFVPERPAANAAKADWVDYVASLGATPDGLTVAELIAVADELEG